MPLWIPLALCAACLQVARTGLQKSLSKEVDHYAATWARYVFALPAVPFIALGMWLGGGGFPDATPLFWLYCFGGGVAQIIATVMLLHLFTLRNFAVSTSLAKTEGVQIALLGVLVFAEPPSFIGGVGIALGGAAIVLMLPRRQSGYTPGSVAVGLGAGLLFALTAWFIRLAGGELSGDSALVHSLSVLITMVTIQSLVMWIVLSARGDNFSRLWQARRKAWAVGMTSLVGSFCWFTAFLLTNPAYVKTMAQIELPLAYCLGRLAFREKPERKEMLGMAVAALAAVMVAFA